MFGMQMGRMGQTGAASWLQTFNSLYANGEKGINKLDFSDFTGMYQDRARTIPYTAVEQPLGSFTGLNGTTATAPADVNRGVVSARVNQLTTTETCAGSDWTLSAGVTLEANAAPSPIGPSTATIVTTSGVGYHAVAYKALVWSGGATRSVELKKGNWRYVGITDRRQDGGGVVIDFDTGTVLGNSRFLSPTVVPLGDGWFRVGFSVSDYAAVFQNGLVIQFFTGQSTSPQAAVGLVGATVIIRAASFTLAADAHLPYQSVNTPTDYDTAGFPHYLAFNGTNTAYATPSIDFTGTDKMTVWAGITKLSDAATSILLESSANTNSNSGSFYITAPEWPGASSLSFKSRGSLNTAPVSLVDNTAPVSRVVVGLGDIGGDVATIRAAGASNTSTQDQGTGNYGNYPLYIGARAGTSLFFNGSISSLIVRGAATPQPIKEAVNNLIKNIMRLP